MSETNTDQLDPEAGFTTSPSVSQAATDLRSAAGAKAKELIHTAETKAGELREVAGSKASALKTAASEKAGQIKGVATEQWQTTQVKAKELHGTAEQYIRENPTKCVLGALGVGFLAGLIMRR